MNMPLTDGMQNTLRSSSYFKMGLNPSPSHMSTTEHFCWHKQHQKDDCGQQRIRWAHPGPQAKVCVMGVQDKYGDALTWRWPCQTQQKKYEINAVSWQQVRG